ncbi:dual specificity phosphatase, partial [Dichotomocladium elegans]
SSSGLASRRRNNKNLSLCLSDSSGRLIPTVVTPRTLEFERPATPSNKGGPYQYGPARILPQLFLGAEQNANDLDLCRQLSIQCMLNCAEERTSSTTSNNQPRHYPMGYRKLPWKHNQDNLVTELDKAIAAIDIARDAGYTILVHCQCGVARSATVVIAYVMKTLKMPMQEAYDYVKARAPHISPNLSLLYQLSEYERKKLNSQPSTPTTPTTPTRKFFQFRRSSLTPSLSWKRR